jgi:hypothetical protein
MSKPLATLRNGEGFQIERIGVFMT